MYMGSLLGGWASVTVLVKDFFIDFKVHEFEEDNDQSERLSHDGASSGSYTINDENDNFEADSEFGKQDAEKLYDDLNDDYLSLDLFSVLALSINELQMTLAPEHISKVLVVTGSLVLSSLLLQITWLSFILSRPSNWYHTNKKNSISCSFVKSSYTHALLLFKAIAGKDIADRMDKINSQFLIENDHVQGLIWILGAITMGIISAANRDLEKMLFASVLCRVGGNILGCPGDSHTMENLTKIIPALASIAYIYFINRDVLDIDFTPCIQHCPYCVCSYGQLVIKERLDICNQSEVENFIQGSVLYSNLTYYNLSDPNSAKARWSLIADPATMLTFQAWKPTPGSGVFGTVSSCVFPLQAGPGTGTITLLWSACIFLLGMSWSFLWLRTLKKKNLIPRSDITIGQSNQGSSEKIEQAVAATRTSGQAAAVAGTVSGPASMPLAHSALMFIVGDAGAFKGQA